MIGNKELQCIFLWSKRTFNAPIIHLRKGSNLCSMYPALHLPAVTNPARSSKGEELPLFQHF